MGRAVALELLNQLLYLRGWEEDAIASSDIRKARFVTLLHKVAFFT